MEFKEYFDFDRFLKDKLLEKDVPDEEYDGNGVTYIDTEKEERYKELMSKYEEHYAKYAENKSINVEDKQLNLNSDCKDSNDESCPFLKSEEK